MNILPIRKSDIEKCAELFMRSYNLPPWNHNWSSEMALKYLNEYANTSRFEGYMLYEDDEIAGAIMGHSKTGWKSDMLYIDELFISPNKQKMGYGKFLLNHVEKSAKEQGYELITLMTNKYMPAMKFYERADYIYAENFVFLFKLL